MAWKKTLKYFLLQLRYDEEVRRVVIEPVEMTQEFRRFEYSTPWESFPNFRPKDETEAEAPVPQVESGEKKWLDDKINFITKHIDVTCK